MKITKYEGKNGGADSAEISDGNGNCIRVDACCMTRGTKDVKMVVQEYREDESQNDLKLTDAPEKQREALGGGCSANAASHVEAKGAFGAAPCYALLDSPWGKIELRPTFFVFSSKENADYARYHWAKSMNFQDWRQLVLHESEPLPKGLSSARYEYHPDECKVESHRLAFGKQDTSESPVQSLCIETPVDNLQNG